MNICWHCGCSKGEDKSINNMSVPRQSHHKVLTGLVAFGLETSRIRRIVTLLIVSLFLCSCNLDTCSKRLGFPLSYHLFNKIRIDGSTYCELVNQSLDGNEKAIISLSKVKVYDGAGYEHGAVLIEVIDKMSEQKYIDLLKGDFTTHDISKLFNTYIRAGMDFTDNPKYSRKKVEEAFPLLSQIADPIN